MKAKNIYICLTASLLVITAGCKKFLDVNTDPNHTLKVSESLLLGPIEKTMAGNTIVGEVGAASTYWTQQVSINQPTPTLETYELFPEDVNNTWTYGLYPGIFANPSSMRTAVIFWCLNSMEPLDRLLRIFWRRRLCSALL